MIVSIHKVLTGFVVCAAVFFFSASTVYAIIYTHSGNPVASFTFNDDNTFDLTYTDGRIFAGRNTNIRLRGDDGKSTITFQPADTSVRVKVGDGNAIVHPMVPGEVMFLMRSIFQEVDDIPLGGNGGGNTGGGAEEDLPLGGAGQGSGNGEEEADLPLGGAGQGSGNGGGNTGGGGTGGGGTVTTQNEVGRFNTPTRTGISNPLKNITSIPGFIEALFDRIVIPIGVSIAVLFIIYSGFLFVVAQGNEQKLTQAKATFMWTVIGTAILLGSWAIAVLIKNTVEQLRADVPQHIVYEDISQ